MDKKRYLIAVDPGVTGALAILDTLGLEDFKFETIKDKIMVFKTPPINLKDPNKDKIEKHFFTALAPYNGDAYCIIEKTYSYPGNGHKGAFMFGKINMLAECALLVNNIDYDFISPQQWEKYFLSSKKRTHGELKEDLYQVVRNRYKNLKICKYQADAYLILMYFIENKLQNLFGGKV